MGNIILANSFVLGSFSHPLELMANPMVFFKHRWPKELAIWQNSPPGKIQEEETMDEDLAEWIYTDPIDKENLKAKLRTKNMEKVSLYCKEWAMMATVLWDLANNDDKSPYN